MQAKNSTNEPLSTQKTEDSNPLRTGHLNKSWMAFGLSILGIMGSFIIMSLFSEKAVKIRINGEKFQYPEVRLFLNYVMAFIAATVMRFVNRENISPLRLLDPIFKNENYILSSIFLFFCKFCLWLFLKNNFFSIYFLRICFGDYSLSI